MQEFSKVDFINKLKKARKSKFRTQEQFCKVLGIKRTRYAKYETDTFPSYHILYKISKILEISVDYLLEPYPKTEEKENPQQK